MPLADTLNSALVPVATIIIGYGVYHFFFKEESVEDKFLRDRPLLASNNLKPKPKKSVNTRNFVERMKNGERTMVIFYGSQTGTAEEFAFRISQNARRYGIKSLVLNPEDCDFEEIENMTRDLDVAKNITMVMCLATYGEGDPTDNALEMYDWLTKEDHESDMLDGINFAVFGLGNKTYEKFCHVGKETDKALSKWGGNQLIEVGLGDDNDNIENDFVKWEEQLWQNITEKFEIDVSKISSENQNIYKLVELENQESRIYTGEPYRLGSYDNQKKPYAPNKNPFLATVSKHESSIREDKLGNCSRNYMHIEFDLTDSGLRYEAGDHIAIVPPNSADLVDRLMDMLAIGNVKDRKISLTAVDEEAPKQHPFPCPTNWRSVFKHYLDIAVPVRSNVLNSLLAYCKDPEELAKMRQLAVTGSSEYEEFIVKARRGIVHILEDFPSCRPTAELVAQILPRLQPRYYSISSSYRIDSNTVSVCCVEVDWQSSSKRKIKGVATGWMAGLKPGDKAPVWMRRSQFKLPFKTKFPVIMIGPGTGLAPFRGFLQERTWSKSRGKEIGPNVLFTGFRSEKSDYIYENDLKQFQEEGILDHLFCAFSRDGPEKVYVQHLIAKEKELVWKLLEEGAYVYICGDAKNMARDVQDTLLSIIAENLGTGKTAAGDYLKKMTNKGKYLLDVWS